MTHVNLDAQPDVVRQFVLALSASQEDVVLESAGRPVACVVPPPKSMKGPSTSKAESNGSRAAGEPYPVADFYEPVEFGWTEAGYEVRHKPLKRYSEATHADHPDVTG
jgi:hypothetical protein